MEKSIPFPTGFGFRQKHLKGLALFYELGIKADIYDCSGVNFLIASYSLISIVCKILELTLDYCEIYTYIMNSLGFLIWTFGFILYFRLDQGYKIMKAGKIKNNSYLLLGYLILQYLHVTISINFLYWETMLQKKLDNFETELFGLAAFMFLSLLLVFFCYIFFLNYGLAEKIKEYNSLN